MKNTIKVMVTGLASSGTRWMTSVLSQIPNMLVSHSSFPERLGADAGYPDFAGQDYVVWMLRYEPFRLKSVVRQWPDHNWKDDFLPPALYDSAISVWKTYYRNIIPVSYEGMIGPLGKFYLFHLLMSLGNFDEGLISGIQLDAKDENLKYWNYDKASQT